MKGQRITGIAVILLLLALSGTACLHRTERIAVAADGPTPAATVGRLAGQSAFFLLFDGKGRLLDALVNRYADELGGGIPMVDLLTSRSVTVLVAESYGPQVLDHLKQEGIRPVTFAGAATDAVKEVMRPK
jgi:predicted Fe-Mo cluster-binding NifX family protein